MVMFGGGGLGSMGGMPFGRIPPELRSSVGRVEAGEPEHAVLDVRFDTTFTTNRLSLRLLLGRQPRLLMLIAVVVVVETITLQSGPLLTQIAIDRGILGRSTSTLIATAALYALTVLVGAAASRMRVRWTGRLAASVSTDLRVRVFAHLQRLSLSFFTREQAGVIMTRMTADIEAIQQLLQEGLVQFALQGLTMFVVVGVLFGYNVELTLITLVLVVPLLAGLSLWFRAASGRAYQRVRSAIGAVIADLAESLHGVHVVQAHNRQMYNTAHHRDVTGEYRQANDKTADLAGAYTGATGAIGLVAQGVVLLVGGRMVLGGHLSVGELTAFILYLGALFQPVQQLVQLFNVYQQGQAAVTKLRDLLTTQPDVVDRNGARDLPPIVGEIRLDGVSFAYNSNKMVLRGIDLRIEAGQTIAFVGETGAGKSTIAKLVTRLYDPIEGRVLIDGQDLRDVTQTSLRRQLGVVPQEPFLFAGSVRQNVSYGRPDASEQQIMAAVEMAGLGDYVARLPAGLDTVVLEHGRSLSSGERQLFALARAFLVQPRVLVLDEATSNLDAHSEARVERALDVLLEGRTAILIAHRLSTAMRADRIVVVHGGEIVEVGTHCELFAARGRYAAMYRAWIGTTTKLDTSAAAKGASAFVDRGPNQEGRRSDADL